MWSRTKRKIQRQRKRDKNNTQTLQTLDEIDIMFEGKIDIRKRSVVAQQLKLNPNNVKIRLVLLRIYVQAFAKSKVSEPSRTAVSHTNRT